MTEWLDLALIADETRLAEAIASLDENGRDRALDSLSKVLGMSPNKLVDGLIRLMIERARPFALPARLWARPNTSSDDPRVLIQAHWAKKGIPATKERVAAAADLYARFVDERERTPVGTAELKQCGFRCAHCGLAFCNEQLERWGIVSPFGNRGRDKRDPRKPHWNDTIEFRVPTHDHIWPVSTYGNNAGTNLQILCRGCNHGKENVLATEQLRAWTGLVGRKSLLENMVVDWVHFYTHLREEPCCSRTGKGPSEVELTVELIDPDAPPVFGNLRSVESPGH